METNNAKNNYPIIIPPEIQKLKGLNFSDKALLSQIAVLDRSEIGCFASNRTLGQKIDRSPSFVSKAIKKMYNLGYVTMNEPCKQYGGRRHTRRVREDLKSYKPPLQNEKDKIIENDRQHGKKAKYIYSEEKKEEKKEKRENISSTEILPEDEKKLFQELFKVPFRGKWEFYQNCKTEYQKMHPIFWDSKIAKDFIMLCLKHYQMFNKKVNIDTNIYRQNTLIEIFKLVIIHPPGFFTDFEPATYLRFWNKVITSVKFNNALNRIRIRDYSGDTDIS